MTARSAETLRALRRSIVRINGLLLLVLLATGVAGLFSLWSLNGAFNRSVSRLAEDQHLLTLSRGAQVHTKLGVQEWKNTLLRGRDPIERGNHLKSSLSLLGQAGDDLASAALLDRRSGRSTEIGDIETARGEVHALAERYQHSIDLTATAFDPFAIDHSVVGIDRPIDERIDRIVAAIGSRAAHDETEVRTLGEQRYQTLTRFLWITMLGGATVLTVMLWRLQRSLGT